MNKLYIFFFFTLVTHFVNSQDKIQHTVEFYLASSPTGFDPGIVSLRLNNINYKAQFQFENKGALGASLSLTNGFRKKNSKEDKRFLAENYHLLELSIFYQYALFNFKRHSLRHGIGTYLYKELINRSVSVNEDTDFFESVSILSSYNAVGTYENFYGFLETGYDFYVYKGLHLSLTGRATLLSYNLNYDSNGDPTDEKRLGLNYMLFYGLGYTFGRDKE